MKKFFISILFILTMFVVINAVNAKSLTFYTNNNGINMTEEQYNILEGYYSKEVIENMPQDQFNNALEVDYSKTREVVHYVKTMMLVDGNGNVIKQYDVDVTKAEYDRVGTFVAPKAVCGDGIACWETAYKKVALYLTEQAYPSSIGLIRVLNTWKRIPAVKSFDVIAATYAATYTTTSYHGYQIHDGSTITYNSSSGNFKKTNYGVGLSQNIVDAVSSTLVNDLYIYGRFTNLFYWLTGSICGTYQHATSTTTLAQSQNYTFSQCDGTGLGGVLKFSAGIAPKYDAMQGVRWN